MQEVPKMGAPTVFLLLVSLLGKDDRIIYTFYYRKEIDDLAFFFSSADLTLKSSV